MFVQRSLLTVMAFAFAFALSMYLFAHTLWDGWGRDSAKLAASNICEADEQQSQKVNPNKMLFISCGGFLD